uniref:Uncharacterized protein n=1 Tax=Seriola dumerili TaxID=41447 RepID=A0A3B4THI0_SERDU
MFLKQDIDLTQTLKSTMNHLKKKKLELSERLSQSSDLNIIENGRILNTLCEPDSLKISQHLERPARRASLFCFLSSWNKN